jgi:tRNA pseudouridine55 synthase
VRLRVVCGKGTYLRTLAADLGAALGCGAVVDRLVRTRVGPFTLGDAVPWAALQADSPAALLARVRSADSALTGWPAIRLDARAAARFEHGQSVETAPPRTSRGSLVRVHTADGRLLGVGEVVEGGRTRPVRMLHADRPGTRLRPA